MLVSILTPLHHLHYVTVKCLADFFESWHASKCERTLLKNIEYLVQKYAMWVTLYVELLTLSTGIP